MNVELNSVERKASKKEVTKRKKKRRRTKRKHDRGRTEDKKNMLFLSFEQKNVFVAVTLLSISFFLAKTVACLTFFCTTAAGLLHDDDGNKL